MTKKKRILIVDDDVASTRLLKLNLEQANAYEVRVENWPEEALATAQDFQPHLIILDVMMPRNFGGDVAARFRADETLRQTPIVFFTAAVGKKRNSPAAFFRGCASSGRFSAPLAGEMGGRIAPTEPAARSCNSLRRKS